jgi:tetratricopeptide (TPR) repeat protein
MTTVVRKWLFPIFCTAMLLLSCRGVSEIGDGAFARYLRCADGVSNEHSLHLMKRGGQGCERLPDEVKTVTEAKRFYLQKAWDIRPESPEPPRNIALTYWEDDNYEMALRYFDATRERSPEKLSPVIGMITMYRLLGKRDEALRWVRWLDAQDVPDAHKTGLYLAGKILYEAESYEEARPLLEEALGLAEEAGFFLCGSSFTMRDVEFYLAQVHLRSGDPVMADEFFRSFVGRNHDPDFVSFLNWLTEEGPEDQAGYFSEVEKYWVRVRQ